LAPLRTCGRPRAGKIEESFRGMKSLLRLDAIMNTTQANMEQMVALVMPAFAVRILIGESARDYLFAAPIQPGEAVPRVGSSKMLRGRLTKGLALVGTILVWLPVLAMALTSSIRLGRGGPFMVDYLMPAELFPVVLAGGLLLVGAALGARARRKLIAGSLGGAAIAFLAINVLAQVTGLASGEIGMGGWQWELVVACLALYVLALVILGVAGVLLLRDLFGCHEAKID